MLKFRTCLVLKIELFFNICYNVLKKDIGEFHGRRKEKDNPKKNNSEKEYDKEDY